ncbi:MAG: hypothetical protein HY315_06040 [Acidobacteria bacterium]|nr:hypothetical protein [Acidobacteriota bacterium]
MAVLIQNQATFLSHLSETKLEVAAIRADLEQIKAILLRHDQVLADLPEAIRQKVGSKRGR